MKTDIIEVDGMTCGHCKSSVEGALHQLEGVEKAEVNLDAKQVTVDYDEGKVTVSAMKSEIEDQGFDPK
ncbi:copper chaperone CopZ [Salisediminibacterium selenitireducens]|uniref:Copper chaperone CopZ n=1 Tax=Bacillus selenitireducens (strain ATCC 700615 / DSM 15326 / MLS10) TaxID=439292 RepID=D6XU61_BACIE|nr:copper chaperone CopZ [Salisediminibacterium selenitireducens]ADH99347.1 Heavy metal transport/detoxification protein [[Bacillus] selenitireducens MLS10]